MILKNNECLYWENEDGKNILTVDLDDSPNDPREKMIYLLELFDHMICWSNNYRVGDRHEYKTPCEFAHNMADAFHVEYTDEDDPNTIMKRVSDHGYIAYMPIWAYEHGELAISCGERVYPFNDRFDSYQLGYIYMTEHEAHEYGYTGEKWKENAIALMKAHVEEYNYYLTGQVYGYCHWLQRPDEEKFYDYETTYGFYGPDIDDNVIRECSGAPENAEIWDYNDLVREKGVEFA